MKLDADFLKMQAYANKLFDSLPIIKQESIKNDKDLINQLQYSCVCYGRKLVSLFDKYQVLLKKSQDNQNQNWLNVAMLCETQPSEYAITEYIKKQQRLVEQLYNKVEYLNLQLDSNKSETKLEQPYQKLLSHEKLVTEELQSVIDKLVKELKQSKDDKQAILMELKQRDDQRDKRAFVSPSKSPLSGQKSGKQFFSAQHENSEGKSKFRFQQQMVQSVQNMAIIVGNLLQEAIQKNNITIDVEQLLVDDVQLLSLNITNIVRDISNAVSEKEDAIIDFITRMRQSYEKQLKSEQDGYKECLQTIAEFKDTIKQMEQNQLDSKTLQNQLQQLQNQNKKTKESRKREIEKSLSRELPLFIIIDESVDSDLQLQVEKHNHRIEEKQEELHKQLKIRGQTNEHINQKLLIIKVGVEESITRMSLVLQELIRMADSQESQGLVGLCKEELTSLVDSVQNIEVNHSIEQEIKSQRQQWVMQVENMRKSYEDQFQRLLADLDSYNEQSHQFQNISSGLQNDNDQLVKKLRIHQQESMQLKDHNSQLIQSINDLERANRQLKDLLITKEEEERKIRQTLIDLEQELTKTRKEHSSNKRQLESDTQGLVQQFKDKVSVLEIENAAYKKQLAQIEEDFLKLKQQRQQLETSSENEKQLLKKHLEEKKRLVQQTQQELKETQEESSEQIEYLTIEVERSQKQLLLKEEELKQLNKTLTDLEDFSRKQIDLIRQQEEKISEVYQLKRSLECSNEGNDQLCSQLQQKLNQLANQNQRLTQENEKLLTDFGGLQKQYSKQGEQLNEEFRDKSNKLQEINKILKEENRNLKAQLELKSTQLRQCDVEIKEKSAEIEKAHKISKQLNTQLSEFRNKVIQIEDLKVDTQSAYEQMHQKIAQLNQENFQLQREVDRLQQLIHKLQRQNDNQDSALANEISNLKSELNKLENVLNNERYSSQSEINNYKSQLMDLQKAHQQFDLSMRQKSGQSIQGGSAFYENLIEAKDLEISRLTGIVKQLTDIRK